MEKNNHSAEKSRCAEAGEPFRLKNETAVSLGSRKSRGFLRVRHAGRRRRVSFYIRCPPIGKDGESREKS
jgi:hypothetical protein